MSDIDTAKETAKKTARTVKEEANRMQATQAEYAEAFRGMAEKGVEQAKNNYARLRTAAEEATDLVEDTYLTATRGITEFNLRAIEALRANVNANFDYARELLAAKSLSEAVELSASHMRQQFEALAGQAKEFSQLAQKVTADAAEPFKASVDRNLRAH
jgi:phasin